jgi:hypothetical protein
MAPLSLSLSLFAPSSLHLLFCRLSSFWKRARGRACGRERETPRKRERRGIGSKEERERERKSEGGSGWEGERDGGRGREEWQETGKEYMGRIFAEENPGSAAFVPRENQMRAWPCTFSFSNLMGRRCAGAKSSNRCEAANRRCAAAIRRRSKTSTEDVAGPRRDACARSAGTTCMALTAACDHLLNRRNTPCRPAKVYACFLPSKDKSFRVCFHALFSCGMCKVLAPLD